MADALIGAIAETDSALLLTDSDGGKVRLTATGGALVTTVAGFTAATFGGSSSSPVVVDTAGHKFNSMYFDSGATSGEAVGIYDRLYLTGAGGEGIALRAFTSVTDVAAANARGAHISLSFGASGTITGLGAALEATLHIPSGGGAAGTLYAVKAAINSDGAGSDPAGATQLAYFAAVNQGDATGGADVDDDAVLFHIDGHTIADDNMVDEKATEYALAEITHGIKVRVGSTTMWLLASTTNPKST